MTNPEILKLAETCGFDMYANENGDCWECWEHQLLKFARAIYSEGFSDGCKEGSYSDYTWMRP
jgi:phage pi2 protein 07